jgi:hypothetical protein
VITVAAEGADAEAALASLAVELSPYVTPLETISNQLSAVSHQITPDG